MSPTAIYPPLGRMGDKAQARSVPLATVLTRLDPAFEEPLDRAALLPGYAEYEKAVADFDGWPATGEPLVLYRTGSGSEQMLQVVSGVHVLAAAKAVCKPDVPCFFVSKSQIGPWVQANAEGGLSAPRASVDPDEEYWLRALDH